MDRGDSCTTLWTYSAPLDCTLKSGENGPFRVVNVVPPFKNVAADARGA